MTALVLALTLGAGGSADAFAPIAAVLQSPRCRNCHPAGDAPRVGDAGLPHRMAISRRSPEVGLVCSSCHRAQNADAGGPPGIEGWRMPGRDHPMPFEGLTPAALCAQLLDRARNGGRDRAALRRHLAEDPLVLWGWSPGGDRTPPPLEHAELVAAFDAWSAAGARCPK